MRIRLLCALAVLAVVDSAHAGRKQILRAFASAVYPITGEATLGPGQCDCIEAPCEGARDVVLACGAAGISGTSFARSTRIVVAQPAAAQDGRAECNVCGCNDGPTDPLTLRAEGTCLAVPGR